MRFRKESVERREEKEHERRVVAEEVATHDRDERDMEVREQPHPLIEDGQITAPIKGATLIGNGPDVLTRVSMVGNDLKLDEGVGTCGKDGQAVPVGVGIPTIKIDRLTVGGTAKKDPGGFMQ